jgi:membrane associated rhomboid family serine protease
MDRSLSEEIKYQWKYGGAHIQLIGINLVVFILIGILMAFGRLAYGEFNNPMEYVLKFIFALNGNLIGFLQRPWGLFTSIFAHFELFHFLFNMVFLYFSSLLFLRYFSNSRLIYTYVLGGLMGGLFQIIAYSVFPALKEVNSYVIGASGSVMAIFMAVSFYRPMEVVRLFGVFPVKLIFIAGVFILLDLLRLGTSDNVAHFAHLGGIAFGAWSIKNIHGTTNIITITQRWLENVKRHFKKEPKLKVRKGGGDKSYTATDDAFKAHKKARQDEIDAILDKISKSGYDSLTKKEKQILFDQSKNG